MTLGHRIYGTTKQYRNQRVELGEVTGDLSGGSAITGSDARTLEEWAAAIVGMEGVAVAASVTEVLTGTATDRSVTPDALAGLWERGSSLAITGGVITIGDGGLFKVNSGSGPVTSITWSNLKEGRRALVSFVTGPSYPLTITHSSALYCPGNTDLIVANGDVIEVYNQDDTTVARVNTVSRASGKGIVPWTFAEITSKPTTLSGYGITDGAPLASPTFTGTPAGPAAPSWTTKTTQLATTAFVSKLIYSPGAVSVADDQVGDLLTLTAAGSGASSVTGLLAVGSLTVARVSLFAVTAFGTNAISTMFLGTNCLNGGNSGAGAPSAGAGTDGNMIVYVSDDDHVYVSNRLGVTSSLSAVFIPML